MPCSPLVQRKARSPMATETRARFTPGPWEIAPHPDDAEYLEICVDYEKIAGGRKQAHWIAECDAGIDSDMSDEEADRAVETNQANAQFVSAAPDLYTALQAFFVKWEQVLPAITSAFVMMQIHGSTYNGPNLEAELLAMRAALRKAEGGSCTATEPPTSADRNDEGSARFL